jgi:hypothetical protein
MATLWHAGFANVCYSLAQPWLIVLDGCQQFGSNVEGKCCLVVMSFMMTVTRGWMKEGAKSIMYTPSRGGIERSDGQHACLWVGPQVGLLEIGSAFQH